MATSLRDPARDALLEAEARLFERMGLSPEVHEIEVPGLGCRVRVFEFGSGPATLAIHGSPNAAATWVQLVAAMPQRRFLLLERPGAGLSTPATWRSHREDTVEIVRTVLDALGVDSVDLIGSSFGGLYAYNFTLAAPHRVRTLTQLGAPTGVEGMAMPFVFRLTNLPGAESVMPRMFAPTVDAAKAGWRDLGHGDALDRNVMPEELFAWYAALCAHGVTLTSVVREIRAIATLFGFRPGIQWRAEELAQIVCPTLYIWGELDNFATPRQGEALAALTPGAQFVELPKCGHLPWCDEPDAIAERLREFMNKETK